MNKEINMKKDPAVELARIFGCLLVVGVHCWINNFGVAIQSKSGTYIACIFADGVAVFWIISGFFMYKNYSYKQTLKRTIKSIVIPMLLLSVAMFFVLNNYLNGIKKKWIADKHHLFQEEELEQILSMRVRTEKVAIKDIKLRTFIAEGNSRNDLAAHVYDITYGSIVPFEDNLVVIDDSIVRGTTLKQSIISILDRLHPKKIVIVSSSPQVRYPDYYGIDMSRMNEFIAFKAAVALLEERGMENVLMDAYQKAKKQERESLAEVNYVKEIYAPFTDEEISSKMVDLLTPVGTKAQVQIVYQTIEGLHASCPNHPGDWYFSGDYPTPGGVRMVNRAFIHYMEEEYLVK